MRLIIIIFIFLLINNANAQNLVPNAGFEEYKYLSCDIRDFIEDFVESWSQPLGTSTDYWHEDVYFNMDQDECDRLVIVPPFAAHIGKAMTGIVTYEYLADNIWSDYKEYLHTQLLQPINEKKVYAIEFYYRTDNRYDWVTNNLGFYFSKDFIDQKSGDYPSSLSFEPQFNIIIQNRKINKRYLETIINVFNKSIIYYNLFTNSF